MAYHRPMPARKNRSVLPLADVLGHGASDKRIDILRRIGEVGSISEAARTSGVSYKAAWQALETLANLAGVPLVEKAVGGSGGGGARLTAAGLQVLRAADALQQARARTLAGLADGPGGSASVPDDGLTGVQRAALALRTSMRNQFPCVVASLRPAQGMVRVRLSLADGLELHSRITRESAQLLGLQTGLPVMALCKATAVAVVAPVAPGELRPGSNRVSGTVIRAPRNAGEVGLQLATGLGLVGFAAAGHGLRTGQPALAWLDESAVVLALPG